MSSSVANALNGPRVVQVGACKQNKAERFDLYGKAGERILLEFPSGDIVESASSTNERILVVGAMGAPTIGGADVSTAPNKVEIRPLFEVPAFQVLVTFICNWLPHYLRAGRRARFMRWLKPASLKA